MDVLQMLKDRRQLLLADLDRFNDAIALLTPAPEPPRVTSPDNAVRNGIVALVQKGPKTVWQFQQALGIGARRARRVAEELVKNGMLESRQIGKVTHYGVRSEELRIVAGEGVID